MTRLRAEKVAKIADSIPDLKVEGNQDADLLIVGLVEHTVICIRLWMS